MDELFFPAEEHRALADSMQSAMVVSAPVSGRVWLIQVPRCPGKARWRRVLFTNSIYQPAWPQAPPTLRI